MSATSTLQSSERPTRLFLLWNNLRTGRYVSIAQLIRRSQSPRYEFRYLPGFAEAHLQGLDPLLSFPDRERIYDSDELFPFFENRLMRRSRPDYAAYVQNLNLDPDTATDMEILGRSSGERATDSFALMSEPEPVPGSPEQYQVLFFVSGIARADRGAWQRVATLAAGDRLAQEEDGRLSYAGSVLGEVPRLVRDLLPDASKSAAIEVVRRNRSALRFTLLCRCTFQSEDPLRQLLHGPSEQGSTPQSGLAAPFPRLWHGDPVAPLLASLIERLADGNTPELPALAAVVGGTLFGRELRGREISLSVDPVDQSLRLSGTDHDTGVRLLYDITGLPAEAHLDLADGSVVEDADIGARGSGATWWCQLLSWRWQSITAQRDPVRYWVGILPEADLDHNWLNLAVSTLHREALLGLHVEGSPSWTLLKLPGQGTSNARSPLAVIVQSDPQRQDPRTEAYEAVSCLAVATGVAAPRIFYGYDQHLRICAAFAPRWTEAPVLESALPVRPLRHAQVPQRVDQVWPTPFLHCLRRALHDRTLPSAYDALMHALVYFRWGQQERRTPVQLALLGVVARTLIHSAPGSASADATAATPSGVTTTLQRLIGQRRLHVPEGAIATLELSHRMALFGEEGVRGAGTDVRSFWSSGQWEKSTEALRMLLATLLASSIRYFGPVVGRLHSIRAYSVPHDPWLELDSDGQRQKAEQTTMADKRYVVGDFKGMD